MSLTPSPSAPPASLPQSPPAEIHYRIIPINPAAHLFEVSVTVANPDPAGQKFMLPVWIPGSYMIREFARHIVSIRAHASAVAPSRSGAAAEPQAVACTKLDKATWQCAPGRHDELTVTCEIYAWDLTVRAAHLDETHGFFNGANVFLLPLGMEKSPCVVEIQPPAGKQFADWKIGTSLLQTQAPARLSGDKSAARRASAGVSIPAIREFGFFGAENYADLIDHPVEMGTFTHAQFDACGVRHHICVSGRHRADMDRLCEDFKKICEAQIKLFEPESAVAPMDEYWFLVMAAGDGYGGLEHRSSTALLCSRDDLPLPGMKKISNGYRRFLGLVSHEYFHSWNVKRIKPDVFVDYDLSRENYTRQLWFFEGVTSYYDDLMLARTRIVDPLAYLEMIAENIGRVSSQSGRLKQSVADSSFDAWVKYYRQDENSPNALVSYYQKGAMIGLALDLTIRQRTAGAKSLDDVMRALWQQHGKTGIGVAEDGVQAVAEKVADVSLDDFFALAVHGTGDIDFVPLFEHVGIDLSWKIPGQVRPEDPAPVTLGARISSDTNGDARLQQVFDGGAAQAAGLSAGDVVIAVDGLRVNGASLDRRLRTYNAGDRVDVVAFRRDEMMHFTVALQTLPAQTCSLVMRDTPIDAKARRNSWLLTSG